MMKKILIGISIFIVLAAAGVFIYLKTRKLDDFEPLIKQRLQSLVFQATDSLYILDVNKIDADILSSKIVLINIKLVPDMQVWERLKQQRKAPADVFNVEVSGLVIDGINPSEIADTKNISLDILYIKNPKLSLAHLYNKKDTLASTDTVTLFQRIAKGFEELSIKKLVVTDMEFYAENKTKKNKPVVLNGINIDFNEMLINKETQNDTSRFLFAKSAHINLGAFKINTADNLYRFQFDSLDIQTSEKKMYASNIGFVPNYDKEGFSDKLKYYKDRYTIQFKKLVCNNIDWYSLLLNEGVYVDEMELDNGEFLVYGDRTLPFDGKSKRGNYPHQMLMQADIPVYIKKIKASNTNIVYSEKNTISEMESSLVFSSAGGAFENVTNIPEIYNSNPFMKLNADAKLMKTGSFTAAFTFNLSKHKTGDFAVVMDLNKMDGTALQDPAEKLGQFKINKLDINKLYTSIKGNNTQTNGTIKFAYNNLDMDLLKVKEKEGKTELNKKGLVSFIANAFVIRKDNPKKAGEQPKTYTMQLQRSPEVSFFGFIWKTILDGMLQTMAGKKTDVAKPVTK